MFHITGNIAPRFDQDDLGMTFKVYRDTSNTLAFVARDKDKDPITFMVTLTTGDGVVTSSYATSKRDNIDLSEYQGEFSWSPDGVPGYMEILADDGSGGKAIMRPRVVVCKCENSGKCKFDYIQVSTTCIHITKSQ